VAEYFPSSPDAGTMPSIVPKKTKNAKYKVGSAKRKTKSAKMIVGTPTKQYFIFALCALIFALILPL